MTTTPSAADLGYQEAVPSGADLGYEDAAPTTGTPSTADLGYEEALPSGADLGYVDATLADLGYEEAAPSGADLGYEDAAPTTPSAADLGYEEALPSGANLGYEDRDPAPPDLGYEEAVPSGTDLGYQDAAPTRVKEHVTASDLGYEVQLGSVEETTTGPSSAPPILAGASRRLSWLRRSGRRSSIDVCAMSTTTTPPFMTRQAPRRVTMDHGHHYPTLSSPSHHTLSPRRSSLRGACMETNYHQQKTHHTRRVSFGGAPDINHVPILHTTEQDKNNMFYNERELRTLRHKIGRIVRQEEKLDETEDCWRGLETFAKQRRRYSCSMAMSDQERCQRIILELQHLKDSTPSCESSLSMDSDISEFMMWHRQRTESREQRDLLQSSARRLLGRAMREGNAQAAQDALDARNIYMETMDSEQVQLCFRRRLSAPHCA